MARAKPAITSQALRPARRRAERMQSLAAERAAAGRFCGRKAGPGARADPGPDCHAPPSRGAAADHGEPLSAVDRSATRPETGLAGKAQRSPMDNANHPNGPKLSRERPRGDAGRHAVQLGKRLDMRVSRSSDPVSCWDAPLARPRSTWSWRISSAKKQRPRPGLVTPRARPAIAPPPLPPRRRGAATTPGASSTDADGVPGGAAWRVPRAIAPLGPRPPRRRGEAIAGPRPGSVTPPSGFAAPLSWRRGRSRRSPRPAPRPQFARRPGCGPSSRDAPAVLASAQRRAERMQSLVTSRPGSSTMGGRPSADRRAAFPVRRGAVDSR